MTIRQNHLILLQWKRLNRPLTGNGCGIGGERVFAAAQGQPAKEALRYPHLVRDAAPGAPAGAQSSNLGDIHHFPRPTECLALPERFRSPDLTRSRISSRSNLAKARGRWRPPRPRRSTDESRMIRRYVFVWYTGRGSKPSGRAWAKQLGISHTWLQKLVWQFRADPSEMYREA
jgi:hypothetical protein